MARKRAENLNRGSTPESLIIHTIRSISEKSQRTYIDFGKVQKAPPNLEIVCEDDGLVLEADEVMVMQHLMAHEREVYIDGEKRIIQYGDILESGDRVLIVYDDDTDDYCVIDRVSTYAEGDE